MEGGGCGCGAGMASLGAGGDERGLARHLGGVMWPPEVRQWLLAPEQASGAWRDLGFYCGRAAPPHARGHSVPGQLLSADAVIPVSPAHTPVLPWADLHLRKQPGVAGHSLLHFLWPEQTPRSACPCANLAMD